MTTGEALTIAWAAADQIAGTGGVTAITPKIVWCMMCVATSSNLRVESVIPPEDWKK